MNKLLALHLCDMVIEVLRSTKNTARQGRLAQGDLRGTADHSISKNKNRTPTEKWKREVDQLSNVVYVHTNNHSSKASLLYIFWRQSGCHQDDYERNESNTETRVQNPLSCAWLVVRQNKLGPKDPHQICGHQKSTCWHANQREFHAWRVQPSSFAQHNEFLVVLFQQSQQFSFCSDRKAERHVKERPRTDFPVRWRNEKPIFPVKARPVNLVLRSPWSARDNPPQDLGYPVNPVNVDEGQKIIILVQGDLLGPPTAQKSNVLKWGDRKMPNSVSWKQERPGGTFELYGYNETCTGSDSKNRFSKHEYMTKIFHVFQKKLGITASCSTSSMEALKTYVLRCRKSMFSSTKAAIHLGRDYLANLVVTRTRILRTCRVRLIPHRNW